MILRRGQGRELVRCEDMILIVRRRGGDMRKAVLLDLSWPGPAERVRLVTPTTDIRPSALSEYLSILFIMESSVMLSRIYHPSI
jgi:hypothetical protein